MTEEPHVDPATATRLADQRQRDLDDTERRASEVEYERGKRETLEAAHTAEQDRRLAEINGKVGRAADGLNTLSTRLGRLEGEFNEFTAIQKALAEKGVSTRTFLMGIAALLIPVLILVVTLAVTKS